MAVALQQTDLSACCIPILTTWLSFHMLSIIQFVFYRHAHLSSQNVYPCIMPAAATEARQFKVSDLPATSS